MLKDCGDYVTLAPLVRVSEEESVLHRDDFVLERLAGDIDRSVEEIQQELVLLVDFVDLLLNVDPGKLHRRGPGDHIIFEVRRSNLLHSGKLVVDIHLDIRANPGKDNDKDGQSVLHRFT